MVTTCYSLSVLYIVILCTSPVSTDTSVIAPFSISFLFLLPSLPFFLSQVLSWLHPVTHASITRCSQPLVGTMNRRSKEDEQYMQEILKANDKSNKLYILDARPKINAMTNVVCIVLIFVGKFLPSLPPSLPFLLLLSPPPSLSLPFSFSLFYCSLFPSPPLSPSLSLSPFFIAPFSPPPLSLFLSLSLRQWEVVMNTRTAMLIWISVSLTLGIYM